MVMTRLKKSSTVFALLLALGGGLTAGAALADVPSKPADLRVMDTNKDGKVSKEEYLAFMGKLFDQAAGAKGYCTFEEIDHAFRSMPQKYWVPAY